MIKKYKVIYTLAFYDDLYQILNYIKNVLKNPIAANNLFEEVMDKIEQRTYFPLSYKCFISKYNYYKIYIKNYVIFYIVYKDYIEIKRMLLNKTNFFNL